MERLLQHLPGCHRDAPQPVQGDQRVLSALRKEKTIIAPPQRREGKGTA
jgi:hypothetical protein